MQDSRKAFKLQRDMHDIIPEMACNFDQLYKPLFRPLKSVWHRDDDTSPNTDPKIEFMKNLKGTRQEVFAMHSGLQKEFEHHSKIRKTTGRDPRLDMPENWRSAMTIVTFLWGNGEIGPLTFCIPDGFMRPTEIVEFNTRWRGQASLYIYIYRA